MSTIERYSSPIVIYTRWMIYQVRVHFSIERISVYWNADICRKLSNNLGDLKKFSVCHMRNRAEKLKIIKITNILFLNWFSDSCCLTSVVLRFADDCFFSSVSVYPRDRATCVLCAHTLIDTMCKCLKFGRKKIRSIYDIW